MMSEHDVSDSLVRLSSTSLEIGDMDLEETPSLVTVSVYPAALATHEEVLADSQLFLTTLQKFRVSMGGALGRIPHVAGKELDLHKLYTQVTAKGGLDKVIRDKLWKEISTVFSFPPTCTSGSYTLRKYYSKFLHDYEQVYFFRNIGAPVPAPATTSGKSADGDQSGVTSPKKKKQKKSNGPKSKGVPEPSPPLLGARVSGVIDSRFDFGYFVTVHHHGQEFKGILYHQEPLAQGEIPVQPTFLPQATAEFLASPEPSKGKKKKRDGKKDRNAPKMNKTAFNFFSVEAREKVKAEDPTLGEKDISRGVGEMWQKTPPEDRAPFVDMAAADKQRYERELKEYNEILELKRQEMAAEVIAEAAAEAANQANQDANQATRMMMVDPTGVILPIGLSGHESATAALAEAMAAEPDQNMQVGQHDQNMGQHDQNIARRSLEPMFQA